MNESYLKTIIKMLESKDEKTKKEYIITVTIHVNKNQIFNDNVYEYDTIGLPFLSELGRQLIK